MIYEPLLMHAYVCLIWQFWQLSLFVCGVVSSVLCFMCEAVRHWCVLNHIPKQELVSYVILFFLVGHVRKSWGSFLTIVPLWDRYLHSCTATYGRWYLYFFIKSQVWYLITHFNPVQLFCSTYVERGRAQHNNMYCTKGEYYVFLGTHPTCTASCDI